MDRIALRREQPADRRIVERLVRDAFATAEVSSGGEALLLHRLRDVNGFVPELNFVAERDGQVVGQIAYTRSRIVTDQAEWETLTLGPVGVPPKVQRQGIRSALITHTLDLARGLGFRAALLFGNPVYYSRFGFADAARFGVTTHDGANFPAFMALPLSDGALDAVAGRLIDDPTFTTLDPTEAETFNRGLDEHECSKRHR